MRRTLTSILFLAVTFLFSNQAQAFLPNPSQLARFQAGLMTRLPPFKSTGSMQFKEASFPYSLNWVDPERYVVEIKGIPARFYSAGQGGDTWTLVRNKTSCLMTAGSIKMTCPPAQAWALLELSGMPESAAQGLYTSELIDVGEIPLTQSDSETYVESRKENRVAISIASNGNAPAALLSLQGRKTEEDGDGNIFPEILFDQTFLKPVLLRLRRKGEVFTIQGKSDLEIRRGRTRYTYVFAEKLSVDSNLKLSSVIRRSVPTFSGALKEMPPQAKTLHQIDTLRDTLSVEGQFLLDSLLLTH